MSTADQLKIQAQDIARAVSESEFKRLLGLPRSQNFTENVESVARAARDWYATNGNPYVAFARIPLNTVAPPRIELENSVTLHSGQLAQRLLNEEAHAIVVVAATAGPIVAEKIARHWEEGHPDEAFFLDRFASAVAEQLLQWSTTHLCRESESSQETLLPHLSPGCEDWDLTEQHLLMSLLSDDTRIGPIDLLSTGALRPQHSVLAALGVTRKKVLVVQKDICRSCNLTPCDFRRSPFGGERRL
jgi:hypothetical protein